MKQSCLAATIAAFALASAALAQPAAGQSRGSAQPVVEAVQMPAWIERDGATRIPLVPGMAVREHDRLRTGGNSRLLLRTPDGSMVKLGENATLTIERSQLGRDRVFQAALKVVEGAFRFTTEVADKFRGRRNVNITVATVTAGIRGTDLWGKSSPDRQVVCLIEGRIEVTPPGESPIAMDSPLSFYIRDQGRSLPVAPVSAEQLKQWALETETQPGRGVSRRGGRWRIIAATAETQEAALRAYDALRDAGYAAEIRPAQADEKKVYTVRLSNFATQQDAQAVVSSLKQQGPLREYDYKVTR